MTNEWIDQDVPENAKYGKYDVYFEGSCVGRNQTYAAACSTMITIAEIRIAKYRLIDWRWEHTEEVLLEIDGYDPEYCAAVSYLHPQFWDGEKGELFIFHDIDLFGVLRFGEHLS